MGQIGAPEPAPAGIANFKILFPVQQANSKSISTGFLPQRRPARVAGGWPVSVAPALGGSFRPFDGASATQSAGVIASATAPAPPRMQMPRFDLAAMGGIQAAEERPSPATPRACEAWMPVPSAQVAERFVDFAFADLRRATIPAHCPPISALELAAETAPAPLEIPALCEAWMPVPSAQAAERFIDLASAGVVTAATPARYPSISALELATEAAPAPLEVPVLCEAWMPVPAAQPVERFLSVALAPPQPLAVHLPPIDDLPIASTFVREVHATAPSLQPQAVAAAVWPVLDSRPAAYYRPPFQLRFGLHAVDEVAANTPAAVQSPPPSGAIEGPVPMPVESMPAGRVFEPAVLPSSPEVRLPSVRCLTAQVLPQARAVGGPAAIPVETLPACDSVRIAPVKMRPALRFPTLARFQPAADPAEPLAAPVAAPGPQPVESIPTFAAFQAIPHTVAPRIAAGNFLPALRAEFGYPAVSLSGPQVVEPRQPLAAPAALDPLSRIAAQPAGSQPERPKPAMPRPGLISLEYHSQRIASVPAKRIEALETRVAIVHQPFAVPPAHRRTPGLEKKRLVLPFEQLFAKKNGNSSRVNITLAGKIAATVMVGLALWTGSRVANLGQHTEALRAEVAASERTVTAAEVRRADFGTGPVGKLRRAIADRAATEITDNFHGGMSAWGAAPKSVSAGWKRHPEGYVSVGDMALFQPSLQYTDYRMEFYGQIEDKSMGWVVRAQDKKNYYAMKFKVIEPGLRPIIAMVHYGVVNGKPGHKIETPLSVMVHNNQPYHVAVEVRGNHFTASIEGETVESWSDEALSKGGVGFFAEAGEKARLYWMRLSRNQDWLGRVCAYMSGDGRAPQQTAELWAPEIPHEKPEPVHPRPAELARAAAALDITNSPGRAKAAQERRSEAWI